MDEAFAGWLASSGFLRFVPFPSKSNLGVSGSLVRHDTQPRCPVRIDVAETPRGYFGDTGFVGEGMDGVRSLNYCGVLIALVLSLASCAAEPRSGSKEVSQPANPVARSVPGKPVHMGTINEPVALAGKVGTGRSGVEDYARLFAARLIGDDYPDAPTPLLVQEIPALERGTWTVLPDNRMETRYRLRPTTWHDGAPFTAEDVIFTWRVIMNPDLPIIDRVPERSIEDIVALDAHTIVIRWREPYIQADAYELEPLPQHILEPLLLTDPRPFVNTAYWAHEWIGLGPYRLAEWVPGTYLKGKAFADYALGAPRIEEFFVHFIADANQAVARILAGTLDLTSGSMLKIEEGVLLRDQWASRGEGVMLARAGNQVASIDLQFREPLPPPSRDVRVRRAMAHALDRELLVDTLHHGLAAPAYGFLRTEHPAFARAEQLITRYPYDPNLAARLLAEAGWTRGPDGVLRNPERGRFDLELRNVSGVREVKDAEGMVEFFKKVGINAEFEPVPRPLQNDQEYRAKFPGASVSYQRSDDLGRWQSIGIPSAANGWRGGNRGGYSRPEVDSLIDTYYSTLDRGQRYDTLAQLLKLLSEDLPNITVYHVTDVFAVRKGLIGAAPPGLGKRWTLFNAHELYWET